MRLDESPQFFPGACVSCGGGTDLVDTGRELPMFGRVYICKTCVLEAGGVVGMIRPELATELLTEADKVPHLEARALDAERDLAQVQSSVRRTLALGAVNTQRASSKPPDYKLRVVPGQKAPAI